MHEAYKTHSLINLTVQIESITAYGDSFLVGTRQGDLFMYNLERRDDKCEVQLVRCNKGFSKKAIQQIEIIPEHNLLLSLTDNLVQLHDLNANFNTVHTLHKTKSASLFTVNTLKQKTMTGGDSILVRLAVAVKRKLQFYFLKNNEFHQLREDILLPDIPKAMVWCEETICIGYRGEYALIQVDGETTELFPTSSSRSSDPCIVKVSEKIFALCRDSQTILVNTKGQTENTKSLRWSSVPSTLAWDEPYCLGVFAECVEIQTLEPGGMVQTLPELAKIRFLIRCTQGLIYAASVTQVWCISAVDVAIQRQVLTENKQYQLALRLTEISNENEEDKKEKIHQIQTCLAYDLFANKKFHESMKEFLKLETDPYDVIRLFPDLLPQGTGATESIVKDLTEKELETGLLALIDYLTERRHRLQSEVQQPNVNARGNLNERTNYSKVTQQLLQIIDTTLLKCYLQTNDALVAPLLRLNHCHLGEAEKILKKMGKHSELIILYQTKGQHRRALELLQNEKRVEQTINYLQHLGSDNMGLIIEFSDWVLSASPEDGLKIFTEDVAEVEALPRPRVLDFLLRSHTSVVIPYLEHVVHVWNDTNPLFHNALIHQYREKALNQTEATASGEHARKKILDFLKTSEFYTPDTVLGHFPLDDLLEERAIILGRLGKHEQALAIYVRALGDIRKAVEYAETIHNNQSVGSQNVFVSLIKLVLNPDSFPLSLPKVSLSPTTAQPDLELALELIKTHGGKMNPLDVLAVLPDNVPVTRIHEFLLVALEKVVRERRHLQLLKGLLYAEHLQCQELRLNLQRQHVLVTELNVCQVCKKRFVNQSALVRYPNGDVVHFSCQERKM